MYIVRCSAIVYIVRGKSLMIFFYSYQSFDWFTAVFYVFLFVLKVLRPRYLSLLMFSIICFIYSILGFLLLILPFTSLWIMLFSRPSCRNMCPIIWSFLVLIHYYSFCFFLNLFNTSLFIIFSIDFLCKKCLIFYSI